MDGTQDKTYNGWTNYETWNVKLWLDNDDSNQSWQRELASDARRTRYPKAHLMDALKDALQETMPVIPASMFSDLLQAAFDNVNWYEIAEAILKDNPDEETEEDN